MISISFLYNILKGRMLQIIIKTCIIVFGAILLKKMCRQHTLESEIDSDNIKFLLTELTTG